jgi:plastocyanin
MSRNLRDRLFLPIGIPLLAVLVIGAIVWSLSRILLLSSKDVAPIIAIAVAAAILLGAGFVSSLRRVPLASFAPLAVLLFAALVAGGVGAAVMDEPAAEEGGHAAEDGGDGPAATPDVVVEISAQNVAFDKDTLTVQAGVTVGVEFTNQEAVQHNVAFYESGQASPPQAEGDIFQGETISGPGETITYTFQAPEEPGTYFFRCDLHPQQMTGNLVVE